MTLRDLLAAIEADAAAEAARLRAERTAAAEAIIAGAGRRAGELQAAAAAAAESEERQAGELRLAAARAEASNRIQEAHEAAYQQIVSDVRDRLRAVRDRGDYPQILAALIAEARAALPACAVVRVDPADDPLARSLLCGEDKLRVEPALSCAGGAEADDGAGGAATNTVEARLAAAEHMVARSARAHQLRVLTAAGPAAEPAVAALQRETDDLNLLLALRLREAANGQAAGSPPDTTGPPYLPGGNIPDGQLAAVQHAPARADVLAAAAQGPARWQSPLAAWADGDDLATLHASVETERLRAEFRLLLRADPLGAAAAVYHVLAHQAQARNIRLLAQAAAGAIGHDAVRHHLVTPV